MSQDKAAIVNEEASYNAGVESFNRDPNGAKNPFPENSENAKAWEQGFLDAQKAASHGGNDANSPPHHK